jgi:hypothetical protein
MDSGWNESENVLTWLGARRSGGDHRQFSVRIEGTPGSITGYSRAGVVLDLYQRMKAAGPSDPAWPQFELTADRGVTARTTAAAAPLAAVNHLLEEIARESVEAPSRWRPTWEHMSAPVTIDGHDYLIVILRASGRRSNDERLQTDTLSLLVLAR